MADESVILGGRYQLDEIIGRGGMAEVWRARDTRLDREVAVKRLRVDLALDSTFQARFQREAQSAARLNHPNIVSVYDTGEEVDSRTGVSVPYIVMELVHGRTLRDMIQGDDVITPAQACRYTAGVLDALDYSHKRAIIHRDIKPANVMIDTSGQIKVMDFGIARAVSDTSATMTQTAAVIGTAQYLSPEQARGDTVDSRSDVYAAGCLLYELLAGRPPFIGDSPVSVAYQHVREVPVPPSQLNSDVTPAMDAVVMQALAKDPDDRYSSAANMAADCRRLLAGQAVTADPTMVMVPAVAPEPDPAPTRALPMEEEPYLDDTADYVDYDDEGEDDEEGGRRISRGTWVMIGLLVLVLAGLGIFVYMMMKPDDTDTQVEVPDVIGFQVDAAVEQIEQAQLTAQVEEATGPAEGRGTVMDQDPRGETIVQVGSTVTLTVNSGAPTATIPEGLVGMTEREAIRALKDAGFEDVNVLDAPAGDDQPNAKPGDVVRVSPASGSSVSTEETVTLYVSSGQSSLPSVVNRPEQEAIDRLADAGFHNVNVLYEETDRATPGTVISMAPEAGTTYLRSNQVTLTVAKEMPEPEPEPEPTPTPQQPSGPPPGQQPGDQPT